MTHENDVESSTAYSEWSAKKPHERRSLKRAAALADLLSLRHDRRMPTLGIVGSKGKGTTAVFASAYLSAAGFKVGTVLSPGLSSDRDRIRVDGANLTEADYRGLLNDVREALDQVPADADAPGYMSPSGFFMVSALLHFHRVGCDVAVVEAGIGGASDELSIFELDGLAISQVFLEHTEILGKTRREIAENKAAVATRSTMFVNYLGQSPEAEEEIVRRATGVGAALKRVDPASSSIPAEYLPPGLNAQNAMLGMESAADMIKLGVLSDCAAPSIEVVAKSVRYPGRLSLHSHAESEILVDSSVSRDGLAAAIEYAKIQFGELPGLLLVSIPVDKDYVGFQAELESLPTRVVFVTMTGSHLPFPEKASWSREWATSEDLSRLLLESKSVLAVGTVTFSAMILRIVGVDTARIF